jgi:hypothetical protein
VFRLIFTCARRLFVTAPYDRQTNRRKSGPVMPALVLSLFNAMCRETSTGAPLILGVASAFPGRRKICYSERRNTRRMCTNWADVRLSSPELRGRLENWKTSRTGEAAIIALITVKTCNFHYYNTWRGRTYIDVERIAISPYCKTVISVEYFSQIQPLAH